MTTAYEIQGLRDGRWTTLFFPFPTILQVAARTNELQKANPACRYRWRAIESNNDIMTTLTEDQIERRVESRMNSLDARLMNGSLTQAEYDKETHALNQWAEAQYNARRAS
jgi:hypothetical protein